MNIEALIQKLEGNFEFQEPENDDGISTGRTVIEAGKAVTLIREHFAQELSKPRRVLDENALEKAVASYYRTERPSDIDDTLTLKLCHQFLCAYHVAISASKIWPNDEKNTKQEPQQDVVEAVARAIYHNDVTHHPYSSEYIEEIFKAFKERYKVLAKAAIAAYIQNTVSNNGVVGGADASARKDEGHADSLAPQLDRATASDNTSPASPSEVSAALDEAWHRDAYYVCKEGDPTYKTYYRGFNEGWKATQQRDIDMVGNATDWSELSGELHDFISEHCFIGNANGENVIETDFIPAQVRELVEPYLKHASPPIEVSVDEGRLRDVFEHLKTSSLNFSFCKRLVQAYLEAIHKRETTSTKTEPAATQAGNGGEI